MPGPTHDTATAPADAPAVRDRLVDALRLDLVGPPAGHRLAEERLPGWVRPSNWYLTGFLIPSGTRPERRADADEDDDLDTVPDTAGLAEESAEDRRSAKKGFFPSSIGVSVLLPPEAAALAVTVRWGDYAVRPGQADRGEPESVWERQPQARTLTAAIPTPAAAGGDGAPKMLDVPDSGGLRLHVTARAIHAGRLADFPDGARAVSVFLVNRRPPDDATPDTAYAFQAELDLRALDTKALDTRALDTRAGVAFVPQPDLRGVGADTWDDRVADLHYADTPEYATGHGVSVDWTLEDDGTCRRVRTDWLPLATVEKTATEDVPDAELSLDVLGGLTDGAAAEAALRPLVTTYRDWIAARRNDLAARPDGLRATRRATADELLRRADTAADRIERGIEVLAADADVLDAFRLANRAVARALRQRRPEAFQDAGPRWRTFQLAFLLLNLPGLADPHDPHRDTVDLLFFPTGGGKTEAYLGLAATTLVLRRLRHPGQGGHQGAGMSVLMRYTLRLLTLDQLARAAGLVCALELERAANPERYGRWPFEIGLWVGKAATPNIMGRKGDQRRDSARALTMQFKANPRGRPPPIPLERCP